MNLKRAKKIRQVLRSRFADGITERDRKYDQLGVHSGKHRYTVQTKEADGTVKTHKDTAIQIRLTAGCPRHVYHEVKYHVQSLRIA